VDRQGKPDRSVNLTHAANRRSRGMSPMGARRHDYGQEGGIDEDGGLENQECSPTRTRAIGARKSEPENSEAFRQGARAQDLPRLQAGQATARPLILTET
jgi:hypothetical protein